MLFDGRSCCRDDAPMVVSSEKGNKHILKNKNRQKIYQYRVDGDILSSNDGEKCDFIVEVETQSKSTAFVIELKGSDLEKAIRQIETTINRFGISRTYNVQPRIIIHRARTQQVHGSVYRSFKNKFPQAIVKEHIFEEDVIWHLLYTPI